MKKILPLIILFPLVTFAAGLTDILDRSLSIVTGILTPLAFSLCLLYFFWGMVKYIKDGAASEKAAEEGKSIMVWGIVGLFVAVSVWGIISFIKSELTLPNIEKVERPNS